MADYSGRHLLGADRSVFKLSGRQRTESGSDHISAEQAVAAAGLWIYLGIFHREDLKIRLRDFMVFIGTGVCSIVFFNIMYFITIERTTLSVAAILLYTAPCFVMLMSAAVFHEKITGMKMVALLLALLDAAVRPGFLRAAPPGFR